MRAEFVGVGQGLHRLRQRRALVQALREGIAASRQNADGHIRFRPRDEGVLLLLGVRDRLRANLIGRPDRGGGRRKAKKTHRRMERDPGVRESLRVEIGEIREPDRRSVFGVVGVDPGVLEPGDIDETGRPEPEEPARR